MVTQTFGKYEMCNDLPKCGLLGGSTYVGLSQGEVAGRGIFENKARALCRFQICKMIKANGQNPFVSFGEIV